MHLFTADAGLGWADRSVDWLARYQPRSMTSITNIVRSATATPASTRSHHVSSRPSRGRSRLPIALVSDRNIGVTYHNAHVVVTIKLRSRLKLCTRPAVAPYSASDFAQGTTHRLSRIIAAVRPSSRYCSAKLEAWVRYEQKRRTGGCSIPQPVTQPHRSPASEKNRPVRHYATITV